MILAYFFRFFFFTFMVTSFALIAILWFNEIISQLFTKYLGLQEILGQVLNTTILFGELIINLAFIISFCVYNVNFRKSYEWIASQSLGISPIKNSIPIFLFCIFCGFLIYINQSYFAAYRKVDLLKNYENLANNWIVKNEKISYLNKEKKELTEVFIQPDTFEIDKIKIFHKDKEKEINFLLRKITSEEFSSNPKFLQGKQKDFVFEENLFYLNFSQLIQFVVKKDLIFSYIFFQKIADMLAPLFLFFILLGKSTELTNNDFIKKTVYRIFFCILFLLTNQVGIFLFKVNYSYPFFFAFYTYLLWGGFLLIKYARK